MQVFAINTTQSEWSGQAFSPDGRYIVVPGQLEGYWCLDTQTGVAHHIAPLGAMINPGLAFLADGSLVLSVAGNANVYPLPGIAPAKGEVVSPRQNLGHWHRVLASRPDGRTVYASLYDGGKVIVRGWDGVTLAPLPRFGRNDGYFLFLTVAGDGSRVAGVIESFDSGASCELRVWEPAGGGGRVRAREWCRINLKTPVKALALSADGKIVATADRYRILAWEAATGKELFRYRHGSKMPNAVAFSPARPLLASGGNDGLVYLFELNGTARGQSVARLNWKIGPILGLAFSPDGLRCAAVGKKKVVVWDLDE